MSIQESVLALVAAGKTTKAVATTLGISFATARYHRSKGKRKDATVLRIARHRKCIKGKAIDYSGGGCLRCCYNRCHGALDFHHLDPNEKDRKIACGKTYSWVKTKIEVDKTILLCKICHVEYHAGLWIIEQSLVARQIDIRK